MGMRPFIVGVRALIFIPLSILVLAATATVLLFLGADERFVNGPLARRWARFVLWLASARVTVSGEENIPHDDGSCIVVMNHQSNMDIPVLVHAVPLQLRFIGKIELRRFPVFGSALLRAGHFLINRKDRESSTKGIRSAGETVREKNVSLVFAPEGTRSADGRLLPFKKGAFVTAIETGLPILPVVMEGTRRSLPRGSLWARPALIQVRILPVVETGGLSYADRDLLARKVRGMMEESIGGVQADPDRTCP